MFLPVDPSSGLPIYRQIYDQVRRMIAAGTVKAGDRLMSVRELSAVLAINPLTVAKAYGELEREGLVEMRRGLGVFVARAATPVRALSAKRAAGRAAAERFALEAAQAGLDAREACRLVAECWPQDVVGTKEKRGANDE
jgi:GntR family transcriptional regulator